MSLAIRQPTHWEGVFRALDLKGDLPNELSAVTGLMYQVDDFGGREYDFLKRTNRLGHSIRVGAGGAANYSEIKFSFATADTTRRMVIVDKIIINNDPAAATPLEVFWGLCDTSFAGGAGPGTQFDDRDLVPGAGSIPAVIFGAASTPAAVSLLQPAARVCIPVGGNHVSDYPFILTNKPAAATKNVLVFSSQAQNVSFSVTIFYRVRQPVTTEQQP